MGLGARQMEGAGGGWQHHLPQAQWPSPAKAWALQLQNTNQISTLQSYYAYQINYFKTSIWHTVGSQNKMAAAVIIPVIFLECLLQNILIDACVLGSDSGLLQQVRVNERGAGAWSVAVLFPVWNAVTCLHACWGLPRTVLQIGGLTSISLVPSDFLIFYIMTRLTL